jgi:hypothetical protein
VSTLATKRQIGRARKGSPFGSGYRAAVGLPENAEFARDTYLWLQKIVGEYAWSKQIEIWQSIQEHRYTAVQSCHDTGKSFSVSRAGCHWVDTRPDPFLVTTAPTWKQVNSILWREMRRAHRKAELRGRINLDAEWYMGADELVAYGRKPADYDQSAFQGIHALNVLVAIDEACGVPKSLFEAADSLVTNKNGRVIAIGNPDDPASYFAEICKPGSGWNVIQIGAADTPAFTGEEVPDELLDYLISPEWVEERKKRWGVGSPIYQSKVLGLFPEITDDTVFTPRMLKEAQLRELPREDLPKLGQYGVDVARWGEDHTAIYKAHGGRVRLTKTYHMADTMETADFVAMLLKQAQREETAYIDVIGLGAGVYDRLRQQQYRVYPHNSSERAYDNERFHNRRAEVYWMAREMADRGELDLPGDGEDDDLIAQLGSIKWKVTAGGRILLESKEDMKARGLPSPDRADAAIMALIRGHQIRAIDLPEDTDSSITSGLMDRII